MKQESLDNLRTVGFQLSAKFLEHASQAENAGGSKTMQGHFRCFQPVGQRDGIAPRAASETIHHGLKPLAIQSGHEFDQGTLSSTRLEFGNAKRNLHAFRVSGLSLCSR
jgi:hypothetical protein